MLCPKCSTQNRDNAKFCKVCGYSFTAEDAATSSPVSVDPSDTRRATPTHENVSAGVASILPAENRQDAQVVEVVAQPAGADPAPPVQNTTLPEDDISLAPTQILSSQEKMAFQARRWQKETVHSVGSGPASSQSATEASAGTEVAHSTVDEQTMVQQPSSSTADAEQQTVHADGARATDIADMPTIMMSPNGEVTKGEPVQIPPPPPESQLAGNDASISSYAEQADVPPASVTPPTQEPVVSPDVSQTPVGTDVSRPSLPPEEGHDTSVPTGDSASSSALAVGTMIAGRYDVMQVLSENEHEHVYQVTDRQGYQHCWNCGSEQNAQGDEFCIDCGAELLNASYLLHEYPATASANNDAHVLQGTIANTFVEQGKTYVIEQQHAAQMAFPNGVHLLAAGDSDAGNVRRSEPNEDSVLVLQLQRVHESQATPVGVFVVADGMGGHDNGQGASRMTINVISEKLVRELLMPPLETEKSEGLTASIKPMEEDTLVAVFKGAVEEANNVLVQTNQHDKTDMGSTITGFMIVGDAAFIINVGDSRTYMLREDTLYQLTNDHSLVAQLLAGGLIEPDDVYTHPQRSQIFRSLGDKMNVQVDDFKQQVLPGDILISCSDGLWEMVHNPQITDILRNAPDPQTACAQLIETANANGGEDNVSAVVVFVR
ncbi:MAG: hypothetical protein NVSMB49_16030 [Ktedonobacteraceae bacterium]